MFLLYNNYSYLPITHLISLPISYSMYLFIFILIWKWGKHVVPFFIESIHYKTIKPFFFTLQIYNLIGGVSILSDQNNLFMKYILINNYRKRSHFLRETTITPIIIKLLPLSIPFSKLNIHLKRFIYLIFYFIF